MFGHHHWGRGQRLDGDCPPRGMGFAFGPRGPGRGRFGGRGPGEGFGGGGRFGGGRMFGAGDLRLVLLALIAEKPSHGYELIRAIEAKFGGAYAPSPGAVYPTLTLLEEQDFIRAEASGGTKKVYAITPEGQAYLRENEAAVHGVMARMDLSAESMSGQGAHEILHEAMHTLRHAIKMHREWTPEEAERVRRLIEATAREIVLGSGPTPAASGEKA